MRRRASTRSVYRCGALAMVDQGRSRLRTMVALQPLQPPLRHVPAAPGSPCGLACCTACGAAPAARAGTPQHGIHHRRAAGAASDGAWAASTAWLTSVKVGHSHGHLRAVHGQPARPVPAHCATRPAARVPDVAAPAGEHSTRPTPSPAAQRLEHQRLHARRMAAGTASSAE